MIFLNLLGGIHEYFDKKILKTRVIFMRCEKKRRRAWTPWRFCEVAIHGKAFSLFSLSLFFFLFSFFFFFFLVFFFLCVLFSFGSFLFLFFFSYLKVNPLKTYKINLLQFYKEIPF